MKSIIVSSDIRILCLTVFVLFVSTSKISFFLETSRYPTDLSRIKITDDKKTADGTATVF